MRKRVLLLTGSPGVGKTTVLMKVVDSLRARSCNVRGMVSREVRSGSVRVGFEVRDLTSGRTGWLARANAKARPRVGRYRVDMADLELVGVKAIADAVENSEVVVVDEIGPMELFSESFKEAVEKAVNSAKLVVAVVHQKARDDVIDYVKSRDDAELFEVTVENRSILWEVIVKKAVLGLASLREG